MSDQTAAQAAATSAVPQPQQQQAQQQRPQSPDDEFLRLAQVDIPAERRRLKQIQNPTAEQVLMELANTQMDLTEEIARKLVAIRDYQEVLRDYLNSIGEHVEAVEDRLDTVEQYGSETSITPEDAEIILKAVLGTKYVAAQLLGGPFPIQERDEEGKQKLAELVAYAEQAEKIIADSTLVSDDEADEESEEEEDGDEGGDTGDAESYS